MTRRVPDAVLGMLVFLIAELMFFIGLICAYWVLRAGVDLWPPPDQPRLPVLVTGINTIVLLASGGTLWKCLRSDDRARGWLIATLVLGVIFLAVQGFEWMSLLGFGLTTRSSLYGATFYTLVGTHSVHVLAAAGVLVWLLWKGIGHPDRLQAGALFWWFVVGVWPALYLGVYVL